MRRLVVAAITAFTAQSASAADMPDLPILRGSFDERPVVQRPLWQGFYVGGHAGTGSTDVDFTNATKDLIAKTLYGTTIENEHKISEWPMLGEVSKKNNGFGGFAGYNMQWDDTVVGIEASYTRGGASASSFGSMGRNLSTSDGYTYNLLAETAASVKITDMGSLRVRGGYSWNGFLLPYGFVGVGLGIGSSTKAFMVSGNAVNPSAAPPFQNYNFCVPGNCVPAVEVKNNRIMYGYSAGFGVDMMLVGGLFGRLEWEYTKFANPIEITVNTVRAGVGYKF